MGTRFPNRPNRNLGGISFDWRGFITPGVKLLVIICTAVYIIEVLTLLLAGDAYYFEILKWFALIPEAVIHHIPPRIWQPFTYIFLHDSRSLFLIIINMLMLWMFGRENELRWDKRRFLNLVFVGGGGPGNIERIVKAIPYLFFSRE